MSSVDKSPRFLITRLSAIGDCILTLPLACALRDRFPTAHVVWAIEPMAARLLAGHRAVDEFLVIPKGWLKSPRQVRSLRRQLRERRIDTVLDPQSLSKSSLLGWLSGARQRIGFAPPRGRELATWLDNLRIAVGESHLVDATLRLLEPLGVEPREVRFDVPIGRDVDAKMETFVRDAHLTKGYAVINSAASCRARLWPAARFGRVARFLGEQHDLPCVVSWAGPAEAALAQRIVAKSGGHAMLAPETSLAELAALERRARLMIGSDTGPLHLAAAVGTPCVGLYGPTQAARSGPYGPQHVTVESQTPSATHGRRRRHDDSAMRQITVEAVCAACDQMLRRSDPRSTTQSHAA